MSRRWLREHRADVQITACLLAGGALLFGGGIGLGVHIAPVETVTVTRTITKAVPEVCLTALNAAGIEQEQAERNAVQAEYARQHTLAAVDAQTLGDADKALSEQALANAAKLARDEAELARIGAEQSFAENDVLCRTHQAPVVSTSQAVAR